MNPVTRHALRGAALTFVADPWQVGVDDALRYESDALVVFEAGTIADFGAANEVLGRLAPDTTVEAVGPDRLILPGFIDCSRSLSSDPDHRRAMARSCSTGSTATPSSPSSNSPTWPHARAVAEVFLQECLRAGTTTAAVYCTVHPQSVDAFFEAAAARDLRMIAGKVLMDRNAPAALTRHAQARLRRVEGADREVARPRAAALRRHAALRAPAARREQMEMAGALWARASRDLSAVARLREPRRDRVDQGVVSRSARAISMSTITTGCSARAPSTAMASG